MTTTTLNFTKEQLKKFEEEITRAVQEVVKDHNYYETEFEFNKLYIDDEYAVHIDLIGRTYDDEIFPADLESCLNDASLLDAKLGVNYKYSGYRVYEENGVVHEEHICRPNLFTITFASQLHNELNAQIVGKEGACVYTIYVNPDDITIHFVFTTDDPTKHFPNNMKGTSEYEKILQYSKMIAERALKNLNLQNLLSFYGDDCAPNKTNVSVFLSYKKVA